MKAAFDPKGRLVEDELIDGAYSSPQPLLSCGFVHKEVIWTQTSINTVEFVRLRDASCFLRISKFPHDETFIVKVQVLDDATVTVFTGNVWGDVYIYQVANVQAAFDFIDDEAALPEPCLVLVDMVLTKEEFVVRDAVWLQGTNSQKPLLALCTENDKLQIWEQDPLRKQVEKEKADA